MAKIELWYALRQNPYGTENAETGRESEGTMYDAFIVNPVAGHGFALEAMTKAEDILRERKRQWRVYRTERPGHATELAQRLGMDPDVRAVIAVGGDGTAFEVASGMAGSGKPMGILPAGTGNDFIKSTGIPKEPMKALELILTGTPAPADIGSLNDGCFLNVGGTGFDVTVLDNTEKLKGKYRGLTPYLLGLLKAIFQYRPVHLKLTVDGETEEGDYLICSVANGRYFGGGIPICPVADVHDGFLDLVQVENVPRWKIPFYLPGLVFGRVLSFRYTRHRLVKEVRMEGEKLRVNADGEIFPMDQVCFAVRPGKLMLIHGKDGAK